MMYRHGWSGKFAVFCLAVIFMGTLRFAQAQDCNYSISPTNKVHAKSANSGTITVTADPGCAWSAASSNSWLKITSGSTGTGNGSVSYTIDANEGSTMRRGYLSIAGHLYYVVQWGSTCEFIINPTGKDKCYSSTTGSVNVTTYSACDWKVVNTNDWVLITSPTKTTTGGGKVYYTVLPNPNLGSRTGVVWIAGQPFTLRQSGIPYICPTNKTVDCGSSWIFDVPLDNSPNQSVTIVEGDTVTNSLCGLTYSATRTWLVTDHCGNSATCSQTVTVVDRTPPVITCASNKVVYPLGPCVFDRPTAWDDCQGTNVTIMVVNTTTNLLPGCGIVATRTWAAVDACGNSSPTCSQTVTVLPADPPIIRCPNPKTVQCGTPWTFDSPYAQGTNVEVTVVGTITNASDMCVHTFEVVRTWQVRDVCGQTATCSQTVTVIDTLAPEITCLPDKTVPPGAAWSFDRPMVFDLCDGTNVNLTIVSTVTNTVGCSTKVMRIWRATDSCDNSSTCMQTVSISDTNPPMLQCWDIESCEPVVIFTPVAMDSTDPNPTVVCVRADSLPLSAPYPRGNTMVTCTATDNCGNSSECSFNVIMTGSVATGPTDQTVCAGGDVTFSTTVAGPVIDYLWRFNGQLIPGMITGTLTLTNVTPEQAGAYTVEICGPCNHITNTVTLTVNTCLAAPKMKNPTVTSAGEVRLKVDGDPGATYTIECSADLQTWIPIGTAINTNGIIEFTDPDSVTTNHRFYRAVAKQNP